MAPPISVADLAARLGIGTGDNGVDTVLADAITDAQADVEGYLGRVIMPTQFTETGCWAMYGGYDLIPLDEPVRSIDTAVAETAGSPPYDTGYFTVTYTAGLDCTEADKRPILRYVTAHAMNDPQVLRVWEQVTGGHGAITSVSAEGQSISYGAVNFGGGGLAGSGVPGALPSLPSLDRWRRAGRRVFTRKTPIGALASPWPYDGGLWP